MKNKWVLEILWWVFTAVVAAVVLLPIYFNTNGFPFWKSNLIFIISFITLTRYVFLLESTFLARRQIVKIALVFLSIPLIFYLVQELHHFQTFLDEEGVEALVGRIPHRQGEKIVPYVRNEILLFGVGSVISALIFPFRMIASVWQDRNRRKY